MTHTSPEKLIGYVYKLSTVLRDGQQLEISGNLALDAEVADMNKQFDKLVTVMDRLTVKDRITKKKLDIAEGEARANAAQYDLKALEERFTGKMLPTQEKQNKASVERTLHHLMETVSRYKLELAALEEEAK
jgi:hypothetical protein